MRRTVYDIKRQFIIVVVLIIYVFFSVATFVQMFQSTEVAQKSDSVDLESVWLGEEPLHQTFEAFNLMGIRVWVTNESANDSGYLVVSVGDEESREIFLEKRIPCSDITKIALSDYLELRFDEALTKGAKVLYVELYTEGFNGKKLRTYIVPTNNYAVSRVGDERVYEGLGLYFETIQKNPPNILITWIIVTAMLISAAVIYRDILGLNKSNHYLKTTQNLTRGKIILVAGFAAVVCVGLLKQVSPTSHDTIVDYKTDELEEGYLLKEHSSYHQSFRVEDADLKAINIHLRNYLRNNAVFVVSVQDGTDMVYASVQSDELDVSDSSTTAYYVWNISDMDLKVGQDYDLYIYTGFIGEDEQAPVITGIEYIYE